MEAARWIDTTTTTGEAKADAAERLHEATRQVRLALAHEQSAAERLHEAMRQVRLAQAHEQAAIEAFDAASYAHWKTIEYPAWLAAKG